LNCSPPAKGIADDIVGFHCQQAVEKMLKALLAERDVHYEKTHNLRYLIELLARHGLPMPGDLHEVVALSPYAVRLRYASPQPGGKLDRQWARDLIGRVREWAEAQSGV
jgi:HEPN domain-containing protein